MQEAHVSPPPFRRRARRRTNDRVLSGPTRLPNTRRARTRCLRRESVVTTVSSRVTVVRPSPSSTRRCVSVQYSEPLTLNHRDEIGKDHEEGRAPARVHCLQIQDAALTQALQAVRCSSGVRSSMFSSELCSFELGGEKKTKGAALQFVSIPYHTLTFTSPC